mmetsp:Transcript_38527/g.108920  ORF Transcript_38527/g.108920 Transcript_38527/m.108920 type:complete len:324 (-) Transcript_38527:515-1486(-)
MRALRFNSTDGVRLVEQVVPQAGQDQALVRVLRAGICSTDLEITKGYVPGFDNVMGHEFVGRVESCKSNPEWEGKTVCGEINFACQTCSVCKRKDDMSRNHCPNRTVFGIICQDGCFSDFTVIPVANLIQVPDTIPIQYAVFTEPLAAACRIAEQGFFNPRDRVAVVGDGKLGLLVAQAILVQGVANLTIFGRYTAKMDLVQGASRVLASEAAEQLYRKSFDVCVDATGVLNSSNLFPLLCHDPLPHNLTVIIIPAAAANDRTVDMLRNVHGILWSSHRFPIWNVFRSGCNPAHGNSCAEIDLLSNGRGGFPERVSRQHSGSG